MEKPLSKTSRSILPAINFKLLGAVVFIGAAIALPWTLVEAYRRHHDSGRRFAQPISNVVLFGDSYTDQSRQHDILQGIHPGKNYQEVFPPNTSAPDGGYQWPYYLGIYGSYKIWNYAVGGAVCNNSLTPQSGQPDVSSGQLAWFAQDHIENQGTQDQRLLLDPSSFTVVMFVGTNDVGIGSFSTNNQKPNATLDEVAACQLDSIRHLHTLGARNFILNSLTPLQNTKTFSTDDSKSCYYGSDHNGTALHESITNIIGSMNTLLRDGVNKLNSEWNGNGSVSWFDTYEFFKELHNNPSSYFNGSISAVVDRPCNHCDGTPTCTLEERDSYMYWDDLHPSEQTGRNLAKEMNKKIQGSSNY